MELDEYLDYEIFLQTFRKNKTDGNCTLLLNAGKSIEKLNNDALIHLIYKLYGKYPHNVHRPILLRGVKRKLQSNFYYNLFNKEQSTDIIQNNNYVEKDLGLSDKPVDKINKPTKRKENKMSEEQVKPEEVKQPKPEKPSDELKKMTIDQLIELAKSKNIPQEIIDKIKSRPTGLAKMGFLNLLRKKT